MNLGEGIYKSLDGGRTWKNLGLEATKTIHRIIIDPTNPDVVYVGALGDPFTPNEHRGLYKTSDGGSTWENMGLKESEHISKIIIHPDDSNVVWVAAQGPLWSSGGE